MKFSLFPRKLIRVRAGKAVELSDLWDKQEDHEVVRTATKRIMSALTSELKTLRPGEEPPEIPWDMERDGDRYAELREQTATEKSATPSLLQRIWAKIRK